MQNFAVGVVHFYFYSSLYPSFVPIPSS